MSRKAETVLILLNGELRGASAVRSAARRADAVVAADGGARHAKTLRLEPDYVVGDMDSVGPRPKSWRKTLWWPDLDPDRSDLDKAFDFARGLRAKRVLVAGALGGGLDHELVNLAALEESAKGLDVTVVADQDARLLGPGRHRVSLRKGARFSLLAAPAASLTLSGARFPFSGLLKRGSRGLGNAAKGPVSLSVRSGRVWLIH